MGTTAATALRGAPAREAGASPGVFDVTGFGARRDGSQPDTVAIQKAIDACAAAGGGTVRLPRGDYLSAALVLRSNVDLHLCAEARILGTGNVEDYRPHAAILYAENAHDISVTGQGTIDGRGKGTVGDRYTRYKNIFFERCRYVMLTGVELRDSSRWCTHLFECRGVRIEGLRIDSAINSSNDGLDIDSTRDVFISNCNLRCGDDAIALKCNSTSPCRNITVTNCVFTSRWAALRFGPEARGNFENITVSNCVIHDTFGCGVKLQMTEGAQLKDIVFDNLVMDNVTGPISLRLANWVGGSIGRTGNEGRPIGIFRNVLFNNIRARVAPNAEPGMFDEGQARPGEARSSISMTGLPGHPIEGITLSNIHITFPGGGTAEEAARREFPEQPDTYPEYFMFGILPAYGLYARHAKGLTLANVRFDLASADLRPAIVCDDVEDVELSDFRAGGNPDAESLIRFQNVRRAYIHGSRPLTPSGTWLRVEQAGSREIAMSANDLRGAARPFEAAGGAPASAVEALANLGGN